MTNPTLKKLSDPTLSRSEIADLLEKHIGVGDNEWHCQSAYDALMRIRDTDTRDLARIFAILTKDQDKYCDSIRQVIRILRGQENDT